MKTIDLIKKLQEIDSTDKFIQVSSELNKQGYLVVYDTELKKYFFTRDLRKEIKEAIKKQELSVRQIALFLGYDYNSLIKYLNGHRPIPDKYLERLLSLLNL